jgi:hypothetical protein
MTDPPRLPLHPSEGRSDVCERGLGVLDRVVQNPGSDERLGVAGVMRQSSHLKQMHDEPGGV